MSGDGIGMEVNEVVVCVRRDCCSFIEAKGDFSRRRGSSVRSRFPNRFDP